MLTKLFDNTKPNSLATRFRRKRFKLFLEIIVNFNKPVKILDVGGTESFWKMMNLTSPGLVSVTLANTEEIPITLPNFSYIKCDAKDLSVFKDKEFDMVFSNSVIEHVDDPKKMADEIMRTGRRYFVQTPNYYFPIEPHFIFPFFQFLPLPVRRFLVMNFNMGWFKKCKSIKKVDELINSIKLLKKSDIMRLFPNSKIYKEKFLYIVKSFIIYN